MPNLARIDLTECKAPYYKTANLLASLPPSVTEVVLDRAVEGLKRGDVEVLQQLPNLRSLSASGCNIRDKHAGVLGALSGLQTLVLRDNGLGPEGLWELVQGCSQLTVLDVTGNERLGGRAGDVCAATVHHTSANQHLQLVRG
jgi:Leucine-rich repeat (LRR) protein